MLLDVKMDNKYWDEAIITATYLQNRLLNHVITPDELWTSRKPDIRHIRTFGCKAYVHIPKEKRTKLEKCAKIGILVGYCETSKVYRILEFWSTQMRYL